MKLKVSCDLSFEVSEVSVLILKLRPFRGYQQHISHELYTLNPLLTMIESIDSFGNGSQRLVVPVGDLRIHTSAEALVAAELAIEPNAEFIDIQQLPNDVLPFLLPSRYCESDRFGDLASDITANAQLGYEQVNSITQWVRENIDYIPNSTTYPLSAIEVHQLGHGVCRDLAQVGIALCRSISIPARLVVGYLHNLQPMDLHAWFEAYIGNQWYTFDPTQAELHGGRVIVAFGRDAADVAIFHRFGSGCVLNNMDVRVDLLDN